MMTHRVLGTRRETCPRQLMLVDDCRGLYHPKKCANGWKWHEIAQINRLQVS